MLYATGFTEEDMAKPQIGICSNWYEGNPCNMHLQDLAAKAKKGIKDSDLVGLQFASIGVSDGISMGTSGMSFSLQSRDLIADSIETVVSAQWYDGLIAIPGCDKNIPGSLIAMARLDRPSILIYGGSTAPGSYQNKQLDVVSAFQSYGAYLQGDIDNTERKAIIKRSCPGAGACGGMYTANTMGSAAEALGMSLPYSSSNPAISTDKFAESESVGHYMRQLLTLDLTPSKIMTRKSFENAITLIIALGGSTNAVLHMLAIAAAAEVELTIEDFQRISDKTPLLADLKPSGQYVMTDLHQVGGTPGVLKVLLEHGLLHGDCLTITGKTIAENLMDLPDLTENQKVVYPPSSPLSEKGHLKILKGNLAPQGAVAKLTGKEGRFFSGPAKVFDAEEDMLQALENQNIHKGDVVVIRYEGPKGGPGMPEMLTPTSAIVGAGLHKDVALITDGRFSGGSHGFIVGHVCPEAQEGGPIAYIQDGDIITIDGVNLTIQVDITEDLFQLRKESMPLKPMKPYKGTLGRYIKSVGQASFGCLTDQ